MRMRKVILLLVLFLSSGIVLFPQMGDYALKFNGTDNYVSTDYTTMLNTFTIECWVRGDAAPGTAKVSGVVHKEKNFHIVWDHPESARVGSAIIHTGGTYHHASFGILEANVWYHLAATYDGETLRAYKNGQLVGTNETPTGNPTSETLSLKLGVHADVAADRYFAGNIDEVRIWNTARSEADINADMYRSVNTNASGLVHYFKMEPIGTTLTNNRSGSTDHGTIHGTGANNLAVPSGCFAGPRNGVILDGPSNEGGSDEYVNFATPPTYNNSAVTLEAWINSTSTLPEKEIMAWGNTGGQNVVEFRMSLKKLEFGIDAEGWSSVIGASDINTGSWTHVAVVKSGTSVQLYVNGVLDGTGTIARSPVLNAFRIGTLFQNGVQQAKYYFPGSIDEVRIWNKALTVGEIREKMFCTLAGNESNLVAYFRVDAYGGTTLYDCTSNNRHGTLVNMEGGDWIESECFNTWIGEVNSDWNTPRNWSQNTIPVATDNVGLYKWSTIGNNASVTGNPSLNNLLIARMPSEPQLNSGITVNGNLIVHRQVNLNAQTVQLGPTARLLEGLYYSGRFEGALGSIMTTRTFNSAINNEDFGGIGVTITTSAALGATTITRSHQAIPSVNEGSIHRVIRVEPSNNTELDATFVFHFNDSETGDLSQGSLKLFKSLDGISWTRQDGTVMDTDANTATLTGVNSFSYWTLADQNDPLPVELSAFTANVSGKSVTLNWRTETEVANYGFDVERKAVNSSDWNRAGFVPGNGNSNSPKQYQFTDSPAEGKYLYRLKQIDNDGTVTHSQEIEVEVGTIPDQYALLQNYPNPFNPATQIQYHLPESGMVSLKVYDMLGSEVAVLVQEIQSPGVYTVNYDASGISSGLYFYRLQAGKFTEVKKMMLTR